MQIQNPIRWGIMGCGKIAQLFAEGLATIPDARLQGVASRTLEKATRFGKTHHANSYYGSYEALVKDDKIDVIYIATPHVFHHSNTLLCLQHKKAVLCEKPFAMNRPQVEEMIAEAKKQNVFLMEALWTYFLPHYQYVLELVNSGEMGAITALKADFGFVGNSDPKARLFNKELGGGSLLDIGIYPIFAALTILGKPENIKAKARYSTTGIDENCHMFFTYKNDVKAVLYSDITKKTATEIHISFEKGNLVVHSNFHQPSHITITKNGIAEFIEFPDTSNGYNYEAIHVQKMLRSGKKESPIMTFDRSLELIQLLDTVRKKIGLTYLDATNIN